MRLFLGTVLCLAALAVSDVARASAQTRTHVLIAVGIGGTAEFRESFHAEAARIHTALTEQLGVSTEDVVYLGETVDVAPRMISDRSTRANILEVLGEMAQRAGSGDRVLVILIGHGTESEGEPQFNVPGPDLTPTDFSLAATAFPTQSLALVHTGSASGGWVEPLAGPNRVIIAATRTSREQNATEFGQFFAEAIAGEGSDIDHDGRVSLLEAFMYARQEVERYYEEQNELLTEHAVLEDDGDGQGSSDAGLESADGRLAATFTLGGGARTPVQATDDPVLARLYAERDDIQRRIDELRVVREALPEDEYLARLEPLLVELALKNREIQERGGGA
ncbi:MAG TPA: hypothetical protein VLA09_06055 [Longimicrobiales bacterium]|nr:hypothetical protein [Longimicrobiales bacterium]